MKIDKNQISCANFINNEVNTLGFLKSQSSVASYFPELYAAANSEYSIYRGKHKKSAPTNFSFGSEVKVKIENKYRTLFIEVKILQNYSLATYALSMCDSDTEEKKLIRKFHFDYDPQGNSSLEKKPTYHLQYGGKATPKLESNGVSAETLHDWLSVPRLSISPINLALLLDIVFNEFPNEETNHVIEKSEWRDMIKKNEDEILKPYFLNVNHFILSDHKSNYLLREFFYGK